MLNATNGYGAGHLQPEVKRPSTLPVLETVNVDLETLCPLSLIRSHTKTDDVPNVTDEQLLLYRKSAFEAAELYTGLLFTAQKGVTEQVSRKPGRRWRDSYTYRLRYQSVDGRVYLYGDALGVGTRMIEIEPGTREVQIPVLGGALDMSACCNPCNSGRAVNNGGRVLYMAGYRCPSDIPAGIIVGVLKFIAWSVQNPGDELMSVRNRQTAESTGITGTNNVAWASGAIEQWRMYVNDAI